MAAIDTLAEAVANDATTNVPWLSQSSRLMPEGGLDGRNARRLGGNWLS